MAPQMSRAPERLSCAATEARMNILLGVVKWCARSEKNMQEARTISGEIEGVDTIVECVLSGHAGWQASPRPKAA